MQKLFAILAVALLVVACGNGDKKPQSIEEQLYEYVAQMENYVKADDYEKAESVYEAYEKWVESLNEAQEEELLIVLDKVDERLGILDEVGSACYGAEAANEADVPMVYSNCYDGYLNVRAEPTSKSQILGRLTNGQGAELLGVEGNWCRVRVNGVVGYVSNSYIQSTPTDPVYIDASVVVGRWEMDYGPSNAYDILKIESNGKFVRNFYEMGVGDTISGTWRLSYNKIVLRYSDGTTVAFTVNGKTMTKGEATFYKK